MCVCVHMVCGRVCVNVYTCPCVRVCVCTEREGSTVQTIVLNGANGQAEVYCMVEASNTEVT